MSDVLFYLISLTLKAAALHFRSRPRVFGSLAAAVNVSASTVWKHELTTAAQVRKTSHSLQSDSGGDVGVC